MAKNQYSIKRTAHLGFSPENGTATYKHTSGMYVPAGAIITGINLASPGDITKSGASATLKPQVGGNQIAATFNASDLPADNSLATTAASSNALTAGGELELVEGTTSNATFDGNFSVYVDYLYVS